MRLHVLDLTRIAMDTLSCQGLAEFLLRVLLAHRWCEQGLLLNAVLCDLAKRVHTIAKPLILVLFRIRVLELITIDKALKLVVFNGISPSQSINLLFTSRTFFSILFLYFRLRVIFLLLVEVKNFRADH